MPALLNAKGPGEFIRDHLQDPLVGGRDYVGSMYQAYKEHLRTAGYRKLPCRPTFHKYVWLLKETGAIVFDGAEAISFSDAPPEPLPPNYEPACGMPAPRHYYRLTDPQSAAFDSPEAAWRAQRGLPVSSPRPRPSSLRCHPSNQMRLPCTKSCLTLHRGYARVNHLFFTKMVRILPEASEHS